MRKLISIYLIIILVLLQIPIVGMAEDGDIVLKNVKTLKGNGDPISTIGVGDNFMLRINLDIPNGNNIEDVKVEVKGSNSLILNESNFIKPVEEGGYNVSFNYKYIGGKNYGIPIIVHYKKGYVAHKQSFSINVPNLDPTKGEVVDPGDDPQLPSPPEKHENPTLAIVSSKTINGRVGRVNYLPITIKNPSNSTAENISITAELEGNAPITFEDSGYESISRLNGGRSTEVEFKIRIDENAEDNNYPVKINFQFYNNDGTLFTTSDTVYVKVDNRNRKPLISMGQVEIIPQVSLRGKPTILVFELENIGDLEARDIKISLDGLSNDTFTIVSGFNSKYIERIRGGKSAKVYFDIMPSPKLPGGSHGLDIRLSYKDSANGTYEDSNRFFINLGSNKDQISNLVIENLTCPEGAIGQDEDVKLTFDIKNMGKMDARNIKISVESSDQSAIVAKSVSIKKINTLAPGKSENLSFIFHTGKGAETKNYPISITVEYEDDLTESQERHTITQYVGIYAVNPDDQGGTTPKLIIDRYSFEPSMVRAGENYTMNLSFYNTNSLKAVKNIKIFLTAEEKTDPSGSSGGGNVFTPVGSSNTFYIDSISPRGRVEKDIVMFTAPDAQAKTYTITANFEYEDSQGKEYTATELIGVPVIQQSKLEVSELNYPTEVFPGEPVPIFVEFYNTGKVTLYNMMVKLEGDFQTENGSYYVGNFEMGRSEYFEGMVIPMEAGELSGSLVFTYEDSSGQDVEVREDFAFNVMEPMPMEEFPEGMPPMNERQGGSMKTKIIWALVLLAGAIGGFIFYRKKKEKGMAIDE